MLAFVRRRSGGPPQPRPSVVRGRCGLRRWTVPPQRPGAAGTGQGPGEAVYQKNKLYYLRRTGADHSASEIPISGVASERAYRRVRFSAVVANLRFAPHVRQSTLRARSRITTPAAASAVETGGRASAAEPMRSLPPRWRRRRKLSRPRRATGPPSSTRRACPPTRGPSSSTPPRASP